MSAKPDRPFRVTLELVNALDLLTERVDALDAANSTNGKWSGDAAIARASVIVQAREVVSRFKHPEPRG